MLTSKEGLDLFHKYGVAIQFSETIENGHHLHSIFCDCDKCIQHREKVIKIYGPS